MSINIGDRASWIVTDRDIATDDNGWENQPAPSGSFDCGVERVGGRPLHVRRHVTGPVQGHRKVGMAEAFLHDLGMHPLRQQQRRPLDLSCARSRIEGHSTTR
jgi:hypothetical protein